MASIIDSKKTKRNGKSGKKKKNYRCSIASNSICKLQLYLELVQESCGLFSEYWLAKYGKTGLAAGVVALSSSAMSYGGIVEFLLTQATGSITDKYGRKWTFFVTPSLMTFASFAAFFFPKDINVIWTKNMIAWSFAAIYGGTSTFYHVP